METHGWLLQPFSQDQDSILRCCYLFDNSREDVLVARLLPQLLLEIDNEVAGSDLGSALKKRDDLRLGDQQ